MKRFIADEQIPHLIFEGPAGSGKTTLARILLKEIPSVSLKLNASGKEDRNIETMQVKVKQFAASAVAKGKLKIVFMDEADGMLAPAQESLKNTMEAYNKNCRFIMTCNSVGKIIDPLRSRCIPFTFNEFPKNKVLRLVNNILEAEGIEDVVEEDIVSLIDKHHPDIRTIVNSVQAASLGGKFDPSVLSSLTADPFVICQALLKGHLMTIRQNLAGVKDFTFMYKYLFNTFLTEMVKGDDQRADAAIAIRDALCHDNTVPDREINFVGCCIEIMMALEVEPQFTL